MAAPGQSPLKVFIQSPLGVRDAGVDVSPFVFVAGETGTGINVVEGDDTVTSYTISAAAEKLEWLNGWLYIHLQNGNTERHLGEAITGGPVDHMYQSGGVIYGVRTNGTEFLRYTLNEATASWTLAGQTTVVGQASTSDAIGVQGSTVYTAWDTNVIPDNGGFVPVWDSVQSSGGAWTQIQIDVNEGGQVPIPGYTPHGVAYQIRGSTKLVSSIDVLNWSGASATPFTQWPRTGQTLHPDVTSPAVMGTAVGAVTYIPGIDTGQHGFIDVGASSMTMPITANASCIAAHGNGTDWLLCGDFTSITRGAQTLVETGAVLMRGTVLRTVLSGGGGFGTGSGACWIMANTPPPVLDPPVPDAHNVATLPFTHAFTTTGVDAWYLRQAPVGMTISGAGTISWPVPVIGAQTIEVYAGGAGGYHVVTYTLNVQEVPDVAVLVNDATSDTPYSRQATLNTDPFGVVWSLDANPAGMTVSQTGLIEWDPVVAGVHAVSVRAENAVGFDVESYTLTATEEAPDVQALTDDTGSVGVLYTRQAVLLTGNLGVVWSLDANPAGMLISETGLILWVSPTAGAHTVTVRAQNSVSFDTETYTLTVT